MTTVTALDFDSPAVSYSIAGGEDAARFTIDANTGVLSLVSPPDFEAPADADADNVYEVIVQASDGQLADQQSISVAVQDVNEGGGGIVWNVGHVAVRAFMAERDQVHAVVLRAHRDDRHAQRPRSTEQGVVGEVRSQRYVDRSHDRRPGGGVARRSHDVERQPGAVRQSACVAGRGDDAHAGDARCGQVSKRRLEHEVGA